MSQLRQVTILTISILLVGLVSTSNAQVVGGNVGLYSQAAVNSFTGTSIEGYLIIQGADIVDLSPLSSLQSVGHLLEINNNGSLTNLDGLSNLASVGDRLTIINNASLANLDGLSNLSSVVSSLEVNNNASLTSVDGLSNLTSVGWSLKINDNGLLTSIDGFDNLTSMPGDLEVNNNAALTTLSLSNITSMNTLDVQHNSALTTVSLNNVTSANWMFVAYNETLTSLSMSNLNSMYGVTLDGNPALTTLDGLSNLTSVTLHLYIHNNASLTTLDGLSNLTNVGGNLTIRSHALLTNVDGLSNLTSVGGYLSVNYNPNLNEFCGLHTLLSSAGLSGSYTVEENMVNPTQQQIIADGPCIPVVIPQPMVAAPTPTAHAESVLSIYSDTYENLEGTNFDPDWAQSTVVTVDSVVAESNMLVYEYLNYQGTNLGGPDGIDQDLTVAEYVHVDFWTPHTTELHFWLISRTTGEQAFALPVVTEEWVSVDIPLTHFSDLGLGLTDVFQFKVDGGDGGTIIYFDNLYFGGIAPVSAADLGLPTSFAMHQNYPNPFNPTTTINYQLPNLSSASLTVYDVRGHKIINLQDGVKAAGKYEVQWNGNDHAGNQVSTGVYFARFQAGGHSQTIKMVYLR